MLKSSNFVLALRKRLFCRPKEALLPCKTATFRTQNNRFCNALITSGLNNSYSCEKCLHAYRIIFVHKISFLTKTSIVLLQAYNKDKLIICTDNTTINKSLKSTIALCFYQSMHAKRNRIPPANEKQPTTFQKVCIRTFVSATLANGFVLYFANCFL